MSQQQQTDETMMEEEIEIDYENGETEMDDEENEHHRRAVEALLKPSIPEPVNPDLWDTPASPIREQWPTESLLSKSHFTIDTQRCLKCHADLSYAMPMNRPPKPHYLFCPDRTTPQGVISCRDAGYLECFSCGNLNNENSGFVVHRPGNSAYTGQSQIYNFMCKHCHEEQLKGEMGLEETRAMMAKVRQERYENEMQESSQSLAKLADSGPASRYDRRPVYSSSIATNFPRKRPRASTSDVQDEK